MKHLRKFNESSEESVTFKNTDEDIQMFFTDYTDENPDALTIENGLIYDGRFLEDTSYMKDQRFYDLSGEDINYTINTDYTGLTVEFITLGDMIKSEESQASKIDEYLKRIGECIKKKGFKRQSIKGNWLDIKFSKADSRNYYDHGVSNKLGKIGRAELTYDMTADVVDRELITIRNEAWEDGLKFYITGGDQQVVVKLVKR